MKSSLVRHRNVLTRAERLAALEEKDAWDSSRGILGLPKVGHRKVKAGKAEKAAKTETEEESSAEKAE